MNIKGLIFDLDGVIVDTAKYHYMAWKDIADELLIPFTETYNEKLKGVSRNRSFELILEIGNLQLSEEEKEAYCDKKNRRYIEYISKLDESDVLPGVQKILEEARVKGFKIALGSASKNAGYILEKLKLLSLFDCIIDGNKVQKAKPDPEVFVLAAEGMGLPCKACIVFEDAAAGIEAAHRADMMAIGVGSVEYLEKADLVIDGFSKIDIENILDCLNESSY